MNRYEYHLIAGDSLLNSAPASLEFKTKQFWYSFWEGVFQNNGCSIKPSYENLLRHDIVSVLTQNGEPIALSCSSLFDMKLKSTRSHPVLCGGVHSALPRGAGKVARSFGHYD